MIWSRTDRPSRMWSTGRWRRASPVACGSPGPDALADTDFTARLDLSDLPPGSRSSTASPSRIWPIPAAMSATRHRAPAHRAARRARRPLRLLGRRGRPGLGHQPRLGRLSHLRGDAAGDARFLHPFRATRSMPTARSRPRSSSTTARSGRTRHAGQVARSPRPSTITAATSPTTCSTRTSAASPPRCRSSSSGTITRRATTGIPARRWPATTRYTGEQRRRCSPPMRAAPCSNTTRCGPTRWIPSGSIAASPTVRCSTSSCSTSAAIAGPTRRTARPQLDARCGLPRAAAAALAEAARCSPPPRPGR